MWGDMRFKGAWRDYQAQVLGDIDDRFADGRLHVVAAPGAGKTVLGLEIVRRVGRPALVFAPTVAIRDQWVQRLCPLFLDAPPPAGAVSHRLEAPAMLTVATYQALDGVRRAGGLEALAERLNGLGPLTLVLDEAHHLRREWQSALEALAGALADARIVSLTATPPYDASFTEWSRYESLCGPIDLEIGIPELVRNGDLCPHQDHILLSAPTEDALRLLERRRQAVWTLHRSLRTDAALLDGLEAHPWLQEPEAHVEAILEAPEVLSAVLVHLASAGRKLPPAPLRLLGVKPRRVPPPSFFWLETLLDAFIGRRGAAFRLEGPELKRLRDELERHGLIEGGRVRLKESRSIFRLLSASLGKLSGVGDIACAEDAALGPRLRMVVLSDHIRAEDLAADAAPPHRPARLGVVPLFEHLRRLGVAEGRVGVMSGSLVIAPRAALGELIGCAGAYGLAPGDLRAVDMPGRPDHVRVETSGASPAGLLPAMTDVFARGGVRILVGTQSLLGEGWDAPALNTLVLASNAASYVLSNQMRGRAIRVDPQDPAKVANIWHLATVVPARGALAEMVESVNWGELRDDEPEALSDPAVLRRRFRGFEGISNGESLLIESGLARLGVDFAGDLGTTNRRTLALATDRAAIADRWGRSLGGGAARARVRETASPVYSPRVLTWTETLQALTWTAASSAVCAGGEALTNVDGMSGLGAVAMTVGGGAALAGLPKLARAARLMWRNGSVEGNLGQVTRVILLALAEARLVDDIEARAALIHVRRSLDGRRDVALGGVSRATERMVIQALAEVLGPVENPRHLLVRTSQLGWRLRTDYHAVPAVLGARKAWAEGFARLWRQRVGGSDLIYTRTPAGRRVLLRARAKSLAAGMQRGVERRSAWL